jgi:hypothetical protein
MKKFFLNILLLLIILPAYVGIGLVSIWIIIIRFLFNNYFNSLEVYPFMYKLDEWKDNIVNKYIL